MTVTIPLIDIAPLATSGAAHGQTVAAIGDACREIGFLSIIGTGVSIALIERMREVVRAVFAVSEERKWSQAITRQLPWLYPDGTVPRQWHHSGARSLRGVQAAPGDRQ
jgi:isopenicillin N synthase-like dioxygenase